MKFHINQRVRWTSQAGGSTKTKSGIVVHVVNAGCVPPRENFPSLHRSSGVGLPRDHESYVVRVGTKVYWPRVSGLHLDAGARNVWRPIGEAPVGKTMFLAAAHREGYTTDPYVVWQSNPGEFSRWPHPFPPTHFTGIAPFDAAEDQDAES